MLKIVIVDDEILVINMMRNLLKNVKDVSIIKEFTSSKEALAQIPTLNPDIVFLDIEMPVLSGIELAAQLLDVMEKPNIIFVTAFDQYAVEAFRLNAVHYILKPPKISEIQEAISRISKENECAVASKNNIMKINLFGSIEFLNDDLPLDIKWRTSKAEELFLLLIIHRNGIDKWRIIEYLWDYTDVSKVEQLLYTTIFRVKSSLKQVGIDIQIHNNCSKYYMIIENVVCDYYEFTSIYREYIYTKSINRKMLKKVSLLYKGDLLQYKDYQWVIDIREETAVKANNMLEELQACY